MPFKSDRGNKFLIAQVALEWLDTSVPSHVRLKFHLSAKRLVTVITFEWFVARVNSLKVQRKGEQR